MRKSFASPASPLVIGVIRERTVRDAIAKIKSATLHGATAIDLHLSCLNPEFKNTESIRKIVDQCDLPILALNYSQDYEYNEFEEPEEDRIALLLQAVEAGVAAIDMQAYSYDRYSKKNFREEYKDCGLPFIKEGIHEIVCDPVILEKQKALVNKVHEMGAEVLISCHPMVVLNREEVLALAESLDARDPDIIKIVTRAETEDDMLESVASMIELRRHFKKPVHVHAAGKAGQLSRVVNPLLGGHLLFCNDGFTASSNFAQPDLQTVRTILDNVQKTFIV